MEDNPDPEENKNISFIITDLLNGGSNVVSA